MFVQKTVLSLVGALVMLLACLFGLVFASRAGAATLTVTSNADSGPGTLREAVATANANGEPDEVGFDLPEGQRTIVLTSGQIHFTSPQETTVDGNGVITVSGNDASRVFDVREGASLALRGLTVRDGSAPAQGGDTLEHSGGGIRNASTLNVVDSTVSDNFADQNGGGIYNGEGASLVVTRSTFSGNDANLGGGIYNDGGTTDPDGRVTVSDSEVGGNAAVFSGGGIYNSGVLDVAGTTITGNSADGNAGGGIAQFTLGTVTVSRSTIAGNSSEDGGGVYIDSGDATIKRSTVSGNTGTEEGGGIHSNTNLTDETAIVRNSTVSGNTTLQRGGGIYVFNGLTIVENTTVTDNTAPEGEGAGIATDGGTIGADTTRIEVGSSIVAANDSTDVDVGVEPISLFVSTGYNVVGDGNATGAFSQPSDQTLEDDPGLDPLGSYGGPTQTHRLQPDSPAVDAGTNTGCPETDQRRVQRPQDGDADSTPTCDIGSFELEGPENRAPVVRIARGGSCGPASDMRGTINLALSDPDDPPRSLTLSATSSDRDVVSNGSISFGGGTDASRTLTVARLTGSGTSTLTLMVSDGDLEDQVKIKVISGSAANNTLTGAALSDMIFARRGSDTASGRGANDLLCGGNGKDRLTGGLGADRFGGGQGTDTATDFDSGEGDTKAGIP